MFRIKEPYIIGVEPEFILYKKKYSIAIDNCHFIGHIDNVIKTYFENGKFQVIGRRKTAGPIRSLMIGKPGCRRKSYLFRLPGFFIYRPIIIDTLGEISRYDHISN